MKLTSTETIFEALNQANVRYLVVGGLAVNAYGYQRFTKDIDLVLELVPDNIERAFIALERLGFTPSVPVTADQFADAYLRNEWIKQKNMQVLQLWSDEHKETPIDVFVTEPFEFKKELPRAIKRNLSGSDIPIVALSTLIKMKQDAGRPQDLLDVEKLMALQDDKKD